MESTDYADRAPPGSVAAPLPAQPRRAVLRLDASAIAPIESHVYNHAEWRDPERFYEALSELAAWLSKPAMAAEGRAV